MATRSRVCHVIPVYLVAALANGSNEHTCTDKTMTELYFTVSNAQMEMR